MRKIFAVGAAGGRDHGTRAFISSVCSRQREEADARGGSGVSASSPRRLPGKLNHGILVAIGSLAPGTVARWQVAVVPIRFLIGPFGAVGLC